MQLIGLLSFIIIDNDAQYNAVLDYDAANVQYIQVIEGDIYCGSKNCQGCLYMHAVHCRHTGHA